MKKISLVAISLILVFSLIACSNDSKEEEEVLEKETIEIEEETVTEPEGEDIEKEVHIDSLEERVQGSTYISRVILIELADGNEELKLLENIKGDLSQEDISDIEDMDKDIEYLIFLRDVEGLVDLTDNKSLIIFKEDGQEIVDEIEKILNEN